MRLENEPQPEQQMATVRLSAAELDEVLNRAIARDTKGKNLEPGEATLEDAVEIARELGISEEQVRASLEEVRAERLQGARRDEKRSVVRARRKWAVGFAGTAATALTAVVLMRTLGGNPPLWFWLFTLLGWLATGWLAFAPVSDSEADAIDLTPVAGTCRVCGQPAYTPQASFCEEHRYRGPRK